VFEESLNGKIIIIINRQFDGSDCCGDCGSAIVVKAQERIYTVCSSAGVQGCGVAPGKLIGVREVFNFKKSGSLTGFTVVEIVEVIKNWWPLRW
jgi:hypothetical protein